MSEDVAKVIKQLRYWITTLYTHIHASTLLHELVVAWHTTDYSKGAKGRKVILQTKNTHKNHCTYTTGCPFYAAEHGSLESLHPPEQPVTAVMFKGMIKETSSTFFNNSKFTKWQGSTGYVQKE